jgi:glycosyltransferase involved in cell wall biosynthesis
VDNPFAYLNRAAVFVLSSDHEGFGNVLVEALLCGCPVVSTDCPSGPAEILDNGKYGELVPVGDACSLADAICRTLDAPKDRDFLRARGGEFSIEKAVDNYRRILLEDRPAMARSNTSR